MPRFRRRRFRRRAKPRQMFRKARRIRRRAGKIALRRKLRKDRRKKHNIYKYVVGSHIESPFNSVTHKDILDSSETANWLGSVQDLQILFDNVRTFEDVVWAGQTATAPWGPSNRHLNKISVSGYMDVKIASGLNAGGIYATFFIVKPKRDLTTGSIGQTGTILPGTIVTANQSSAFQPTYENATGWAISSSNVQMTTPQTKPTIADTDLITTPFMVPEFTRNFKVVKVLKYFIPAGGNIRFSLKLSERTIRRGDFEPTSAGETTGQYQVLKKFGKACFVRFHGQPAHEATAHTTVNYGFASLDVMATKRYEFRYGHQAAYWHHKGTNSVGTLTDVVLPGEGEESNEDLGEADP